jgi:hypothetical protein
LDLDSSLASRQLEEAAMRWFAFLLVVVALIGMPVAAHADANPAEAGEDTILGMSYGKAAVVAAAVVAGAVAINTLVAPNVGTVVAVIWVAHWFVQGAVVYGIGSWLGWWDDEVAAEETTAVKN